MPSFRWAPLLLLVLTPFAAAQSGPLKIEPSYPVVMMGDDPGSKDIRVTYFPQNPEARIKGPQQLVLRVGINGRFWRDNKRSVPFVRNQNGAWEAVLSRKESEYWSYLLFLVKDEKTGEVDDNGGQYWELLFYMPSGKPLAMAIEQQASSYAGVDFGNGIARKPDYSQAVSILERAVAGNDPDRYSELLFWYWQYKVKALGDDAAAWRSIAAEIDRFLSDHQYELPPLTSASGFIFNNQAHLSAALLARDLELINRLDPEQAEKIQSMALFAFIRTEKNPRKRAEAYDAFIRKYPKNFEAGTAAAERFRILRDLGDVPGAESAFEQRVDAKPDFADNYAAMAAVYIENNTKLDRAQQLLDKTREMLKSGKQALHGGVILVALNPDPKMAEAAVDYWQARIYLLQGKGDLALPLSLKVLESRKAPDVQFVLAQAYEATGQKEKALDTYLEAILTPSRGQREYMERVEKFWTAAGFVNSDQLLEKIESLQKERFKNAHYVPLLVDRPAPDFEVAALNGEKLRLSELQDKTLVLNFWATWCMPCIPELPGFQQLQSKHPELVVAALAIQSDSESLDKLLRKMKLDSLRIAPGDDLKENYVPAGVPITYVIDHGRIRVVHRGALSDVVAYLEADLTALRAPPSPVAH